MLAPQPPVEPSVDGAAERLSIAFAVDRLDRAGTERQVVQLAGGLARLGHRVGVVCLGGPGDLDEQVRGAGVDLCVFPGGRFGALRRPLWYRQQIRMLQPEVIYAFLPRPFVRATFMKFVTRPAAIVWGIRYSDFDRYSSWRTRLVYRLITRLARFADGYIANSHAGAEYHIRLGYDPARMHVVPNGIDTERFRPDPSSRQRQRHAWGVGDATPVVGMLARFDALKGQDDVVEMAGAVSAALPSARFVMAGRHTADDADRIGQLIGRYGLGNAVRVEGATDSPEEFLAAIDVLVVPSRSEGFPNVVAEALACGTPVVAYDVGDIARIVDGLCPVVPVGDVGALAAGVVSALATSTTDEQRDRYRSSITTRFGPAAAVESTQSVIAGLTRPGTP